MKNSKAIISITILLKFKELASSIFIEILTWKIGNTGAYKK